MSLWTFEPRDVGGEEEDEYIIKRVGSQDIIYIDVDNQVKLGSVNSPISGSGRKFWKVKVINENGKILSICSHLLHCPLYLVVRQYDRNNNPT